MAPATAVTVFHPVPDSRGFDAWLAGLQSSARSAEGFASSSVSIHDAELDWAMAATFHSEDLLHGWLDSGERRAVLKDGQSQGYWCCTTDLLLGEGIAPPAGVGA